MDGSYTFDLHRIFLGDHPPLFLLEIVFRTLVLYIYVLVLLRFLGKRNVQQLTFFEFAIIIALGSAVGDPMFYDDVPLLHGAAVVTVIVLVQRAIALLVERSDVAEKVMESAPTRLIKNGVLDPDALAEERIARNEVFARLRVHGIRQLGEVERAYLEPSGTVSIWEAARPSPGLTLMPDEDDDYPEVFEGVVPAAGLYACMRCGTLHELGGGEAAKCACEGVRFQRPSAERTGEIESKG